MPEDDLLQLTFPKYFVALLWLSSLISNLIYNEILDRDWFCERLLATYT